MRDQQRVQEILGALARPGATVFTSAEAREQAIAELSGVLVVRVTLGSGDRHQLRRQVQRSIDECLARVGLIEGTDRGAQSWQGLAELVFDAAHSQIVVALDGLSRLANGDGRLEGEDSLVLRELLASPLRMMLELDDRGLSLFGPPTSLEDLTLARAAGHAEEASEPAGDRGIALAALVEELAPPALEPVLGLESLIEEASLVPQPLPAVHTGTEEPLGAPFEGSAELSALHSLVGGVPLESHAEDDDEDDDDEVPSRPSRMRIRAAMAGLFSEDEERRSSRPLASAKPQARAEETGRTSSRAAEIDWQPHVRALLAARGPQSLASLEKLYVKHYVPLGAQLMQHAELRQGRARQAFEEFRQNFARVYSEASLAFGARNKRPKMVLDAWALSQKVARAHDARPLLLLVDGLRYDVAQAMNEQLGQHYTCVQEEMLCAALPATTARQLELLARGPEGLLLEHEPPSLEEVLRERTAESVRRIRTGSRELYRLDCIEARLRGSVGPDDIRAAAEQAAAAITRFFSEITSERRQLVYVFGDHGFPFGGSCLDQKGAFPEQVFVPATAFVL